MTEHDARELALVRALGARVRGRRQDRGLTAVALAGRSGLSRRFLADLEAGRANISVVKLHRVALALDTSAAALLEEPGPVPVALLGLRGAGKSTVGPLLAKRLGTTFVELDALIEQQSGMPLPEIFAVHGEAFYRRLEGQAVDGLLARGRPVVVATGGGVVTVPETYDRLKRGCTTVWLRARPKDHLDRVAAQGDQRPMDASADAMAELRQILAARTPLYGEADVEVQTTGVQPEAVADHVLQALALRGVPSW